MSNFGEKLYTPVPLYTEENVRDTIAYIDECLNVPFSSLLRAALMYVRSQLINAPFEGQKTDMERIGGAYQAAAQMRERAVQAKEFVAVVRWRYVMAALSDYRQYLISKEAVI